MSDLNPTDALMKEHKLDRARQELTMLQDDIRMFGITQEDCERVEKLQALIRELESKA